MKLISGILIALSASVSFALPAPLKVLNDWQASGETRDLACEPRGSSLRDFSCDIVDRKSSDKFAATISVTQSFDKYGWDFMSVRTEGRHGASEEQRALGAGYLEGHVMADRITQFIGNTYANQTYSDKVEEYLTENDRWVRHSIETNATSDPYWRQLELLMLQVDGLAMGYADSLGIARDTPWLLRSVRNLQIGGDMEDIESAFPKGGGMPVGAEGQHCSALIKPTAGFDDLLVAQATWGSVNDMLRVLKRYEMDYAGASMPVNIISSYPGLLFSEDDWYVTAGFKAEGEVDEHVMVVQETTIGNSNPELYTKYITPESVLEWARNTIANRMGESGARWAEVYSRYNSGTYNNQNMVVDFTKWTQGTAPKRGDGLLWVVEQIPGYIEARDMSEALGNPNGPPRPDDLPALVPSGDAMLTSGDMEGVLGMAWTSCAPGKPTATGEACPSQGRVPAGILSTSDPVPQVAQGKASTPIAVGGAPAPTVGYWPSYNVAYFPRVYNESGMPPLAKKFGPWFSWADTSRANIFRRNHSYVEEGGAAAMRALMRYNNFEHDPLSTQGQEGLWPPYSSENSIACRDDLNPKNGTYKISAMGYRNHVETDAKITSAKMVANTAAGCPGLAIESQVTNGPTYDQQPPFVFSQSGFANVPHVGMPDKYEFPWVQGYFCLAGQ